MPLDDLLYGTYAQPDPNSGLYNLWPEPVAPEEYARQAQQQRQALLHKQQDQELLRQSQAQSRQEQLDALRQQTVQELQQPAQPTQTTLQDKGIGGNASTAIGQEFGNIGRQGRAAEAVAERNPLKLAAIAAEQQKAEQQTPAPQAAFRAGIKQDQGPYEYFKSLFTSAGKNPEGALDSTLQFAINAATTFGAPELVGAGASALAGGVGAVVGGPLAVGGVQAALSSGEMGIALLRKQAQKDGIDLNNNQQIADWVKSDGVQEVFGKAMASGLTNGAVMGLTLGIAKYAGSAASRLLGESGQVGQAEAAATAAGTQATREGTSTANTLLSQARQAKAAEIGIGTTGFAGSSALSSAVAGEDVDSNSVFANGMMYLVPGLFGARKFIGGTKGEVQKATPSTETSPTATGTSQTEQTTAKGDIVPKQDLTVTPKQDLEEAKIQEIGNQALPKPVTAKDLSDLKSFDELPTEDKATAMQVAVQAEKAAVQEILNEEQAKLEAKKADTAVSPLQQPDTTQSNAVDESAATTATTTDAGDERTGIAPERASEPTGDGEVQQSGSGAASAGSADRGDINQSEEIIRQAVEAESRRGEPTGSASTGSEGTVTEPKLSGVDARGEEPGRPINNEYEDRTGAILRTTFNRYNKGKATSENVIDAVSQHLEKLEGDRYPREKVRGAEWIQEKLLNAKRLGVLTPEQTDIALWLLQQAPHLANDLAISIRRGSAATSRGTYSNLSRLATIFATKAGEDTAVHEILHHTEAMMPRAVQEGIRKEWLQQLRNTINKTIEQLNNGTFEGNSSWKAKPREASLYLKVMLKAAEQGDYEITKALYTGIKDKNGVIQPGLSDFLDYHLSSPSEFWAVNGSRLIRERLSSGGWVGQAAQWLRELYHKIKSVFGYDSDAPVLRAIDKLIKGEGTLNAKRMLDESGSIFKDENKQSEATAKQVQKQGSGDVVGMKDGQPVVRAWQNKDGSYRVYDITDEFPQGDKASKQVMDQDELKQYIESKGADVNDKTAVGFDQEPGNNRNLISRWKDGSLVYTAVRDPEGKWHSQTSEDLTSHTAQRTRNTYETRGEAEQAANKISEHKTKQASDAAQEGKQLKDLLGGNSNVVVPGTPGWVQTRLGDRESSIRYIAGATDAFLKRLGIQAPAGMRLGVTYMLKNSDIGRMTHEMLKNEAEPLLAKTRALMKRYGTFFEGKEGYSRLNSTISDLVASERLPKKRAQFDDETTWVDPQDHSKGYTKYYNDNVKKEQEVNARLTALPAGLRTDLYKHMQEWKRFSDKTIEQKYRDGFLTRDAANRIQNAYDIYAPLVKEGKAKKLLATGTSVEGGNVLERMIEARADAILRGIDNNAVRTLRNMNRTFDYRNEDGSKIFKIDPVDREHLKFDPETGEVSVTSAIDPQKSIVYYEGGMPQRMEINNPTLMKALEPFKGADRDTAIKKLYGAMGFYTRMFGVLHTSASPPFAIRNFVRDYFTNLSQMDQRIKYKDFHKAMFSPDTWGAAFRLGFREAASLTGKDSLHGNSTAAKLAQAIHENGALIEHGSRYGVDQITNEHATTLRPTLKTKAAEYLAPTDGKLTNFVTGLTHSLEAVNRIAVFKAAREAGIDSREAAVLAKNATTNFERRGQFGPNITPWYAFANAKLQGTRTLAENLGFTQLQGPNAGGFRQGLRGLIGGKIAESANPRTVHAAQLAIALGLGAAYANYKASDKDKDGRTTYGKRSEYQLDEYLHIPGLNIDIPIPQEIGSFYNAGSSMGDKMFGDRAGAASTPMIRFATAMMQNFYPGGTSMHDPIGTKGEGGDYAFRLAMPTPFLSLYDNTTNMDTFGRKINPQRDSTTIPPEMQGAANASPLARGAANVLHQTGVMDTSPKLIDHFLLGIFQQQKGMKNAITDGNVGALLQDTFKSFHQEVFPGTNKNDYDAISQEIKQQATREAGNPLKKKQYQGMARDFVNTDAQLDKLKAQYNKTKDPEAQKRIDEKQNDLREKVLKKYYEQTGVTTP